MQSKPLQTLFAGPLTRFIAASGLTNLSDGIATLAWAWIATLLTRDPLLVALMPVALRVPWALGAIPAGLITDRHDRRRLILIADGLRCGCFAVAAVAILWALPLKAAPVSGVSNPGLFALLMLTALVIGGAEVLRDNAAQTLVPSLVPPAALERANGRLWSVELIGNALLGPSIGAVLIAVSLPLPFAFNALALGVAVLIVLRMKVPPRQSQGGRNWRAEVAEGFSFLKGQPVLRLLAWVTGVWNMLHQMVVIALILHVQENLGLGPRAYGLILAAGALGGILGGFVGDRVVRAIGRGRGAQWTLLFSALAFLALPLAQSALGVALILFAFECAGLIWNTISVAYRQRAIPDSLLGRVNSLYRLLAWGMMPLGLVLSGWITRGADRILPRELALTMPFFIAALGAACLVALAWRALGRSFED
ncbi:MFS transporter [Pseudooceanicola algae]|uniref:Enterobactin exporter EntS n=1 Tax=Pseudooceanicola algae TaxID=1537215 RepID=A0A418SDY8_9RHOB|nr:MFS transporter [Pseudooceanicola algae]QPM89575.1 Enterobactin exporter EntS [Pseudooceanicola algae]